MPVDLSSLLYEEVKNNKRKLEKALSAGDSRTAARLARRISELLLELAERRPWSRDEYLRMAAEYESLYKSLSAGGGAGPARAPEGDTAGLDQGFEEEAEKLIVRASVKWSDIAGLEEVKRSLVEALFYSVARPEKPVRLEPPRRILLYGPPGTGKTMLAAAASNMLKATFMSVSVDRVLSRYVGDSPRMVSAVFRVAYRRAPSLVFFDEIEALAARRDSGRDHVSGLVQTLLTELDGLKTKTLDKPVVVIAATNKPWVLDEAVLSRFEKRVYVPLPDFKTRREIFRLHLEGRGFTIEGVTYDELAGATDGYSGRDIRAVCQEAVMSMLRRANPGVGRLVEKEWSPLDVARATYRVLPIKSDEILEAIKRVKPAVSKAELERYEEWAREKGG